MWGRSSIVYSRIIVDLFHWNLLQNLKVRELDRGADKWGLTECDSAMS